MAQRWTLLLLVTIILTGCGPDSKPESETASGDNQLAAQDAERETPTAQPDKVSDEDAAVQEVLKKTADARIEDSNKIRHVVAGMHSFHDARKLLPMAAVGTGEFNKDLSWRVLVLAFLEQYDEYEKFDLSQAWDSAQNKPFIGSEARHEFEMGNGNLICAIKHATPPKTLLSVPDGLSNTIALMESPALDGNKWTSPEDIDVETAVKLVRSLKKGEFLLVAMFDGSVQKIYSTEGKNIKDEEITALFDYRDGASINQDIFSPADN